MTRQCAGLAGQNGRDARNAGLRPFFTNRLKELAFGGLFSTVFLLSQSPLHALVIEDIRVLSKLGEPLSAQVRVIAAAGETLTQGCFSSVRGTGDLPGVGSVRLTLSRQLDSQILRIAGNQPMREPMSEFVLQVKCAGSPTLVRSFLVMVDPPTIVDEALIAQPSIDAAASLAPRSAQASGAPTFAPDARAAIARGAATPIKPGSRYLVRNGDVLSTIAARVEGRPDWSVWPIAQQIFAANPGAFLMGDPNRIMQGASVYIPRLDEVDYSGALEPESAVAAATSSPRVTPATLTDGLRMTPSIPTTPTSATAVAAPPPPVMQLTVTLGNQSLVKLQLRRRAVEMAPTAAPPSIDATHRAEQAAANPGAVQLPDPEPGTQPETPDTAVTTRVALPASANGGAWLGRVGIGAGLLLAFLFGALVASYVLRRRPPRPAPAATPQKAATRPNLKPAAPVMPPAPAPAWAPVEQPDTSFELEQEPVPADIEGPAHTVEINARPDLDLELHHDEPAKTGDPETLQMPAVGESLDLELPVSATGHTGQHEVDFELLEKAYSEDYEAQFVEPHADPRSPNETPSADTGAADENVETPAGGKTSQYYHLENRDPADEAPLPIELGEDEMSGDFEVNESKIVNFPKNSSTG